MATPDLVRRRGRCPRHFERLEDRIQLGDSIGYVLLASLLGTSAGDFAASPVVESAERSRAPASRPGRAAFGHVASRHEPPLTASVLPGSSRIGDAAVHEYGDDADRRVADDVLATTDFGVAEPFVSQPLWDAPAVFAAAWSNDGGGLDAERWPCSVSGRSSGSREPELAHGFSPAPPLGDPLALVTEPALPSQPNATPPSRSGWDAVDELGELVARSMAAGVGGSDPFYLADPAARSFERAAPGPSAASPLQGWRRAIFDGSVWTRGLAFDFSRSNPIETLTGTWQANQPRFGDAVGVQPYSPTSLAIASDHFLDFLGSGWDLDGSTPLLSVFDKTAGVLRWYVGATWTLVSSQTLGPGFDLLNGAVAGKAYVPQAGIIHEGLHVVMASRVDQVSGLVDGVAFFYTQDYGAQWTEVPNVVPDAAPGVPGNPNAIGIPRGDRWAFANAFPNGSRDNPTDAWFAWSDYLKQEGNPKGGQVGIFRAERSAVGQAWNVSANRVLWDRWEPADVGGLHCHGATVHPNEGVVLSWWGDIGYRNEIVAHKFADMSEYETSDIELNREAFGGYTGNPDVHNYSNQSAGFAPGPVYGTALAAADENPERVVVVSVNEAGTAVTLQPLIASSSNAPAGSKYVGRLSLWIHYVRGTGYVLREIGSGMTNGNDGRVWTSADGLVFTKLQDRIEGTPIIFGDSIAFSSTSGPGIQTRLWLPVAEQRPLLVGPGGWNRQATTLAERTAPPDGVTVRPVYRDGAGVYRYVADNTALTPQPLGDPPVHATTPLVEIVVTDTQRSAGTRWLMEAGETTDWGVNHFWQGWVYPLEQRGLSPSYQLGSANNLTTERGPMAMASGEWLPTYHFGKPDDAIEGRGVLWLKQTEAGANRWLLASQSLTKGSSPAYPLAPNQDGAHEVASLGGFTAQTQWSVFLSVVVPEIGFDAYHSNGAQNLTLATLWSDSDDYLEVVYKQSTRRLEFHITSSGVTTVAMTISATWLHKEDRLDLVVASNGQKTEVTAALSQSILNNLPSRSTPLVFAPPTEIRLSNHDQTEVVPLEWLAAHVNPSRFLTATARSNLLELPQLWAQ